jgi:hypothetical protein
MMNNFKCIHCLSGILFYEKFGSIRHSWLVFDDFLPVVDEAIPNKPADAL